MEDFSVNLSQSSSEVSLQLTETSESELSSFEEERSKTYYVQGKQLKLPSMIEEVDLADVLNLNLWSELSDSTKGELIELLPKDQVNTTLEELFTHQIFYISNPIVEFSQNLRKGCYSKKHLRKTKQMQALYQDFMHNYTTNLKQHLEKQLTEPEYQELKRQWNLRKLGYHNFSSDSSSEDDNLSLDFKGCSSGESTLIDEEEEALYEISQRSRRGEEEEKENELKRQGNLDWVRYSSRFRDMNIHKNQLTIKMPSLEWIENYRRQETERYKNPTVPWAYQLEDGSTAIVAPVCKRVGSSNVKARDHSCLKSDRPHYITLLSITRDAAARLPDGVGTRADICQLARDSQYLVDSASDTQISNLVSGALDRLHYEKDPCVKYDSERKLWIYLHRGRGLDWPAWKSEQTVKRGRPPVNLSQEVPKKEFWPLYIEDEIPKKKRK